MQKDLDEQIIYFFNTFNLFCKYSQILLEEVLFKKHKKKTL